MKRIAFAVCLAVVLAGSVAMMAKGEQDFVLINQTGLTIDEFYVSPTTVNDWEEDVLGVDVLKNGDKVTIKFSRDTTACSFDLKIVDEEGDAVVWQAIDLCKANEITLKYEGKHPTAIIK